VAFLQQNVSSTNNFYLVEMDFVLLQSFTNYIDAHIVLGRLQEEDIDCWLKDENVVTINPIWTNATGGIKLMVAQNQLQKAQSLLLEFDTEKRSRFRCPYCNSGNIELVSSHKEPANWFSVLMGFLFFSYAMPVKIWHCFKCGKEFKEPEEQNEGTGRNGHQL
jgi:DNA-directed RNA polymerase subunit RPC12/RpoP